MINLIWVIEASEICLRGWSGLFKLRAVNQIHQKYMPRIKTEQLEEGMVVSSDVKNIDNMLLIPSGCQLTKRQIGILQAWGVTEIDVASGGKEGDTDVLTKLSEEELQLLKLEVRNRFWRVDDADPVFNELFQILLRRRASRPKVQVPQ